MERQQTTKKRRMQMKLSEKQMKRRVNVYESRRGAEVAGRGEAVRVGLHEDWNVDST